MQGNVLSEAAIVAEKPNHSPVLKANGEPYTYQKTPVGFDLTPSKDK